MKSVLEGLVSRYNTEVEVGMKRALEDLEIFLRFMGAGEVTISLVAQDDRPRICSRESMFRVSGPDMDFLLRVGSLNSWTKADNHPYFEIVYLCPKCNRYNFFSFERNGLAFGRAMKWYFSITKGEENGSTCWYCPK